MENSKLIEAALDGGAVNPTIRNGVLKWYDQNGQPHYLGVNCGGYMLHDFEVRAMAGIVYVKK